MCSMKYDRVVEYLKYLKKQTHVVSLHTSIIHWMETSESFVLKNERLFLELVKKIVIYREWSSLIFLTPL